MGRKINKQSRICGLHIFINSFNGYGLFSSPPITGTVTTTLGNLIISFYNTHFKPVNYTKTCINAYWHLPTQKLNITNELMTQNYRNMKMHTQNNAKSVTSTVSISWLLDLLFRFFKEIYLSLLHCILLF